MLALPQPELLTNFQLSAQAANGSISLYASDEVAVPGSKAWAPLVKSVPVAQVNETKLKKPFSRVAKYLLIETDIADPVPVFSLYAYTDKPAVAYELSKREQSIDSRAISAPTSASRPPLMSRASMRRAMWPTPIPPRASSRGRRRSTTIRNPEFCWPPPPSSPR